MADRYWVGGSGNWDASSTTNWSASSGGLGGASAPTLIDNVIFDAGSNTGTNPFTVTITGVAATPATCANFSTGGAGGALDGAMTLAFGTTTEILDVYGSFTLPAVNFSTSGGTLTTAGQLRFRGSSLNTITTAGVTITAPVEIAGTGSWILGSALTVSNNLFVTTGTFDTTASNYALTVTQLASTGSGVRSIVLNSSAVTLTSTTTVVNFSTATNLTFNSGNSTITISGASTTFLGGGQIFNNVTFTSVAAGTHQITGANTFNNFNCAGRNAAGLRILSFGANTAVIGTMTLGTTNSVFQRFQIHANNNATTPGATVGTQIILDVTTVATLSDVDFRDIRVVGDSVPWSGTRLGNAGGNDETSITFPAPKSVWWSLAAGGSWGASTAWALSSGGVPDINNFPLAQDTAYIVNTNLNSGATITMNNNWWLGTVDWSGRTLPATFAFSSLDPQCYGDFILSSSVTHTGVTSPSLLMYGQNKTQILNSAGVTLALNLLQFWNPNGGTVLAGNTTVQLTAGSSGTTQHIGGTFDLAGYAFSTVFFNSSQAITRTLAFGTNGKIVVTGDAGTAWTTAIVTALTVTGSGTAPLVEFNNAGAVGTRRADFGATNQANSFNVTWVNGGGVIDLRTTSSGIRNLRFENAVTATLTVNAALIVYGNLYIGTGLTATTLNANSITFAAASGTQTITTNGKTINFNLAINSAGTTVVLADTLTMDSARNITLTAGTFTPGQNITVGNFVSSLTGTKTLNMGSTTWTLTGTVWTINSAAVLTFNAGTSTINIASGGFTFTGAGLTYRNVTFQASANTAGSSLLGANTFNNLTFTAGSVTSSRNFFYDSDLVVSGTLSIAGTSATQYVYLLANSFGLPRSITAAAVSGLNYVIFRDVTALGASIPWSGTFLGNAGGNTNITFAASKTVYWNLPAGGVWTATAWALTPAGTPNVANYPLPQDTAVFTNAGLNTSNTVTMDGGWQMPGINFSAMTNAVTLDFNSKDPAIYGNIVFSSTVTLANTGGTSSLTISQYSGTQIITSAGRTFPQTVALGGAYATYQLTDNMATSAQLVLNNGTLNLNGQIVTCQTFSSSITTTRSIDFNSGKIQITGNAATVWNTTISTNFSYTGDSLVELTYAGSVGTRTISALAPVTAPGTAVSFKVLAGTDIIGFTGSNFGCEDLDFTGFAGTLAAGTRFIYGNLILGSGMTVASSTLATIFNGYGNTQTITSNGVVWNANMTMQNLSEVVLAANLTLDPARTFTIASGFLTLSNNVLSTGVFNSSGTAARGVNFGSGKLQVTGNAATILSLGVSFINTGTRLIELTYAGSVGTRTLTISNTGEENQWNVHVLGGTDIVTTTGSTFFNNLNFTGFSGTFAHVVRFFYGNVTLSPTMTVTGGPSAWTWSSVAKTTKTLTTNGIVVDVPITLAQGPDSTWTLGNNLSMTAARALTLTSGTFVTGNYDINIGVFSSTGTGIRSVSLGSSAITLTGSATVWNLITTTNLVFSAGTSTITFDGTGPVIAQMGGLNYNNVVLGVNMVNDIVNNFSLVGANTFNNLTLTAPTVTGRKFITLSADQTVTGTLTSVGATPLNRLAMSSVNNSIVYTVTAAAVNLANTEFRSITAAGSASPWTGTGLGDQGGNSNIIFPPAKIVYWNSLGGGDWSATAWALTSGGTPNLSNFPLPQDSAVIDDVGINSGSVITIDSQWSLPTLTCAGLINDITIAHTLTADFCGDVTLENIVSFVGAGTFFFLKPGAEVESNGAIFSQTMGFNSVLNGTVILMDNFQTTAVCFLNGGGLSLNNNTVTCDRWSSSTTATRFINFGSGQIIVTGNDNTVFNMAIAAGFTYTGTPIVNFTYGGITGTRVIAFASPGGPSGGATAANVLDYNILAGGDTVTLSGLTSFGSLDFTGFAGTKTLNTGNLTFYRDLTWSGSMTAPAGAGSIVFAGTTGTQTLTTNGLTLDFPVQINAPGATVSLGDALTMGNTRTLTLTAGTFNAVNYNVTTGLFAASGTATRTLLMGSGQWTLTGTGTVWNITDATAMTLTAGASTIVMTPLTTSTSTFVGGGLTYNNFLYDPVTYGSVNRLIQISSPNNVWNNFTAIGAFDQRVVVFLANSQTITNTLTLTGTNEYSRVYFSGQASAAGIVNVIAGAVSLNYADFKGITANGAAIPWTGTSLGNLGGNSNITFTTPKIVYWNQLAGGSWTDPAWALTSGGLTSINNFPLAQDTVIFDNTGINASTTVTLSGEFQIGIFNCSALTNSVTFNSTIGQAFNGDVVLSSAVTWTGGSSWNFNFNNKVYNITQGGATINNTRVNQGSTSLSVTINLVDAFTLSSSSLFDFQSGTLNLNNNTLTIGQFLSNNSLVRSIAFGTGNITLTGANITPQLEILSMGNVTNFSYTGTPTVNCITAATTGVRQIRFGRDGGGTESNALNFNFTAGSDTINILGGTTSAYKNINFTGFTGIFTWSNVRNIYGNLTLSAGMGIENNVGNEGFNFATTSGTQQITTNGQIVYFPIIVNAPGATVVLQDALNIDITRTLTLTAGTFNSAGFTVTTGIFSSSGTVVRVLNMGASTWNINNTGAVAIWNITDATNLTLNSGTSTINLSPGNALFSGGGLTYYNLNYTSTAIAAASLTGNNSFNNLTLGATRASAGAGQLGIGDNQTVTGTLTIQAGNTGTSRLLVRSTVPGTARTITAAAVATLTDIDFRDITAAGAAIPWSGTRLGNAGNNTNITFASGVNKYWSLKAGGSWNSTAWALTSGGTASSLNQPLPQDTAIFDDVGLGTEALVTMVANQQIGTLDFSARTELMIFTLSTFTPNIYGNVILNSAVEFIGTGTLFLNAPVGTQTVTTGGAVVYTPVLISVGPTATVRLLDNFDNDRAAFTLDQGTLDLNDFDITALSFSSNNTNVRTIDFGTGEITVIGNNTTVFNTATNTNLTVLGTPVVNCTYAGFTGTRIAEGGATISEANSISINITAGGDTFSLLGGDSYRNVDFTGFSGTLATNTSDRIIYGNLTLSPNMIWADSTGPTSFRGTSGPYTITTNGVTVNAPIVINASGGTYELGGAWIQGSVYDLTLTAGTFNTQNYNLTTRAFLSSNTNVRAVNLGSSTWTLASSGSIVLWNIEISTNMTLTAGTSSIVFDTPTNGTVVFYGGGLTYYNFTSINSVSVFALAMYGTNTFNNVTINVAPVVGRSSFQPYDSFTILGTFTMNGNSPTQNVTIGYNLESSITITAAAVSLSYITFRYITAGGASIFWSGTGFGDAGNNQNIIFGPGRTVYWNLPAGGNWSDNAWAATSGGVPDPVYFPLAQDTAVFDNTGWAAGSSLIINGSWNVGGFDASAVTNAMLINFSAGSFNIYGNVEFSSSITTTGLGASMFLSGTQTVDFAGVPISCYITKSIGGTTTTLLSNVTVLLAPAFFRLSSGSLDLNGFDITCPIWTISTVVGANRAIAFDGGQINVTSNDGTVWNAPDLTGFSYTGTPTVNFTYAGSTGTRFIQNGITAGLTEARAVDFNIVNGSDNVTLTGPGGVRNLVFANEYTGRSNLIGTGFIYGNLRLSPNQTLTVGSVTTFAATSGTRTIETNNLIIGSALSFDGIGGTWQLTDTLNTLNQISLLSGTLDTNNQTVNCSKIAFQGANVKVINMGSSSIYLGANPAGTASALWDLSTSPTNLTVNAGTSTIYLQKQGVTGTQIFYGGGFVYNNVVISDNVVPTQFVGSGTFNNLSNTVTPLDITFEAGQTITTTNWNINGVAGQQVTLASATPGSQWNLAKAGGGYVVVFYCTISDSAAAPGTTWYAPTSIGYLT
jgi:hypothetical protein